MFRLHSKKLPNFHPVQRYFTPICLTCLDHKRYIFISLLILIAVPSFYLISNTPLEIQDLEEVDVCSKLLEILSNSNRTLCSKEADHRGNKQRIISLSIFGPKENPIFIDEKFSQLIIPLIKEAQILFPSWTIRLYSDQSTIDRLNIKNLTRLAKNIDICNINQIPILGNLGEYLAGKLWRFLPALDPMVDLLSSRDLDSPLVEREQVLIDRFLNSTYIFLSIRDHPQHGVPVLGGLWTSALHRNRLLFLRLFSVLLDKNKAKRYALSHDQTLLSEIVWPKVKDRTLVFDSYTCEKYYGGHQQPFPTQRPSRECHLGCVRPCCENSSKIILKKPCPVKCRPKNHSDWLYC